MKRNLNKDEEEAAFRRKNAKDPNPNRKGKAINVKTEDLDLQKMSKELMVHPKCIRVNPNALKTFEKNERSDISFGF